MSRNHAALRGAACAAILLLCGGWILGCSTAPPEESTVERLPLVEGTELWLELIADETRAWSFELAADQYVHLTVEQDGVDVSLHLLDASGDELLVADRPIDFQGEEELAFLGSGSVFRLEIRCADVTPGADGGRGEAYLRVDSVRPASDVDRQRVAAARLFSNAERARWDGEVKTALGLHAQALEAWRRLGDEFWQAEVQERMGRLYAALDDWAEAEVHHGAAAELFRRAGDDWMQAASLHKVGVDLYRHNRPGAAIEPYRQALPLRRRAGDRLGEALTLHALAQAHQVRDETQMALDGYHAAAAILDQVEYPALRASSIHNLGVLYGDQGDWHRAESNLESALELWRELGDEASQAASLNQLGVVLLEQGERDTSSARAEEFWQASAEAFRAALDLRRAAGDLAGEGKTLRNLGRLDRLRGESVRAAELFEQARRILQDLGLPRSQAEVLLRLGELAVDEGRAEEGTEYFRESRDLYRKVGDATGEADSLAGLASALRQLGRLREALQASSAGLALVEEVRPRALSSNLRAGFFAGVQRQFDLQIGILLDLHQREAEAGHAAAALQTAERARARSLLDLLLEQSDRLPAAAPPAFVEREEELTRSIASLDRKRLEIADREHSDDSPQRRQVERQMAELLDEVSDLRASLRAADPSLRRASAADVATFDDMRRAATADGSMLIEYWLGDERGVRWTVSEAGVDVVLLPSRPSLEAAAVRAHNLLERSHRRETLPALRRALCELSSTLLGPEAGSWVATRLVVVPDGALSYVPFGVLPLPMPESRESDGPECDHETPLVARYELVTVPSASTLVTLRSSSDTRDARSTAGTGSGSLAVLADPVFDASDRVTEPATSADRSARPALRRLASSRREAEAILALAPGKTLSLLDFEASKETVLGDALAGYSHLHFATHGFVDADHPELSGIVLSQVDQKGRAKDGTLRTMDFFRLDLPAELVVLSACETALGEEVRGEGLVGLSRGFLAAGAETLVVSLWRVSDGGTATLMEAFYRRLFEDRLEPAAALRLAQLEMAGHPAYSAPYFWSGFVAVGSGRSGDPRSRDSSASSKPLAAGGI